MKTYILAYYGEPKFDSPAEAAAHKAKWAAWVGGLGDDLIDPGTPLGKTKSVSARGVTDSDGADRLLGYSLVKAASLDAALAIAKGCPYLEHGTIDVAEVMRMAA